MSSTIEELVRNGTCAKCGGGVKIGGHEDRVVCTACDMPTDLCTCAGGRGR